MYITYHLKKKSKERKKNKSLDSQVKKKDNVTTLYNKTNYVGN